jgi:cytochrome c biogenesis protein CcmG, thiol:disulfide interchange protein DsbE
MHKAIRFMPIIVLVIIMSVAWLAFRHDPHALAPKHVGKPFPTFHVDDMQHRMMTEASLKGHVTLWHVWASWCQVCAAEWAQIAAHHDDAHWVGMSYQDTSDQVQAWLDLRGNPFSRQIIDVDSRLAFDLGVTGTPETYLVDASGIIRAHWVGPLSPQRWANEVAPALSEWGGRHD